MPFKTGDGLVDDLARAIFAEESAKINPQYARNVTKMKRSANLKSAEYRRNNFIGRGNNNQQGRGNTSPASPSSAASPGLPNSSSSNGTMAASEQLHRERQAQGKIPFFFREDYAGFIVKGNFMTLAAKPALVEEGEWMAHQGTNLPATLSDKL